MLLIKNGRVIDPASKTDAAQDILLDGEKIVELAAPGKLTQRSQRRRSLRCHRLDRRPRLH